MPTERRPGSCAVHFGATQYNNGSRQKLPLVLLMATWHLFTICAMP